MKAIWKGKTIAQSDKTINIENNHYFPPSSVNREYLQSSGTHTVCPWKGVASYYNVVVDGEVNADAAWFYAQPKALAKVIKDYVAFWHGIQVVSE
ncbi:MAG: DUF427 domain-containing protein [Chlorobi bacterium]|nr:DUF427 domain-containing protein [Chlorobiota bacterium]